MADKTITFSKSIVAQKDITGNGTMYITQLSKPIILKGISTKTCKTILYSIDGINFTDEATIGNSNVLSMAIVPFQLGGAEIDSPSNEQFHKDQLIHAFSYILGGRYVNEDININKPISQAEDPDSANGAYRYLLQYLAKNKDNIEWDTGDLFTSLNADRQDSFGGSDFISQISVAIGGNTHELYIDFQDADANGRILMPSIVLPNDDSMSTNIIRIRENQYFFLCPEGCPASDGDPQKLIIDNFWRGGGLLVSHYNSDRTKGILMLYIFAVT